jgi:hypothetical protein
MSLEMYVKEAKRNGQKWLEQNGLPKLKSKASSVLPSGYRPEKMDASKLCDYHTKPLTEENNQPTMAIATVAARK